MHRLIKTLGLVLLVIGAMMMFMLPTLAQDGRINQSDNLGGYAIYCVDNNLNPALHYDQGGIRVLDSTGLEALFVPNADIVAVGEPEENTLLGSAGSLSLYRLGGYPWYFQLNGVDDSGKEFAFLWLECDQSAPAEVEEPVIDPCLVYTGGPSLFISIDPCCPVPGWGPSAFAPCCPFPFGGPSALAPCCYSGPSDLDAIKLAC
ncbi:MAG: hypothetical protein KME04_18690 [Pleurocapsa minor GSE-CHR-MK-17-07R]|jgi:hypothetical protein|nr:hypothetical protein [Pleurocapsa minor GSE-CHR-MK 17-07R]